jgi:glycosyltransferase involved in cell wall biosynthesis
VIVHVTDCFHPRLGGIETQVGELAQAQRERGETVEVITATPPSGVAAQCDYGYPVHRVVAPLPWELPVHPRAGAHLVQLYRKLRPDVVHVHLGSVSPFAWSAVWSALSCNLPTVVTVHSMWGQASRGMYRFLDLLTNWSRAPLVVTAVSSVAANLVTKTAPSVTVTVVPNGIGPQGWRPPADPHDGRGEVHIVAVGRLAPRKQPLALLTTLHAARERIDPDTAMRVTVAGDGPAMPVMRAYLRRHSMTHWVRLAGRLDREAVRCLLQTADLFINPAIRESFGIATLEARTAGVPVIARAGNGISDFITHGQEGLLCDGPDALVGAIVHLVSDADARNRIHTHNRTTQPTNCSWPVVIAAFARCYDRAAARVRPEWTGHHPAPD